MSNVADSAPPDGVFTYATREDGAQKMVRIVEGQLLVCKGCCCGNVERGKPAVPTERFKHEWKARGLRLRVHLTIGGCLGPCAVANVVLVIYQSSTVWFHSINSDADVTRIYDYLESLLASGRFSLPDGALAEEVFQRYSSDAFCPFDAATPP
jgi:cobaltochelatase CobN